MLEYRAQLLGSLLSPDIPDLITSICYLWRAARFVGHRLLTRFFPNPAGSVSMVKGLIFDICSWYIA